MAKDPERRDLFSGALDLMILHSLGLKPMHGYALVKHISAKGRPTRIYRLTKSGARHLEREAKSFEKMSTGIALVLTAVKV
jgi:PadR family transcriptional regulator, regulatory protein PadR